MRAGQVLGALDLADAQGGAGASGLDEQGVAQGPAGLQERLRIPLPGVGADDDVRRRGDAGCAQEHLGDLLVHARGTGQYPAADVGHAHHLQHSLDGSVLPVGPVQQRQDDVDLAEHLGARGCGHREVAASQWGGEGPPPQPVRGDPHRRSAVAELEGGGVVIDKHPLPLGGDADGKDLVAITVDGRQNPGGGSAGDRVLTAATAEDDGDTHFGVVRTGNGGAGFLEVCHRSHATAQGPLSC